MHKLLKLLILVVVILSAAISYHLRADSVASEMNLEPNTDMQQLSASNHSTIAEPFVFVARDSETYALLRAAVSTLPDQPSGFFESQAVVGVFLGQRPTGGYNIDITIGADGVIKIAEHTPPKGSMQKMVLSAPHKVVALPVKSNQALAFELDEAWQKKLLPYNGQPVLEVGIAGRKETIRPKGPISLMRGGELVSYLFAAQRFSGEDSRRVFEVVSGKS